MKKDKLIQFISVMNFKKNIFKNMLALQSHIPQENGIVQVCFIIRFIRFTDINYRQMAAFQYVLACVFFPSQSHKFQENGSFPVQFTFSEALPRTENSIKSNRNVQGLPPLYEQAARHSKKSLEYKICVRVSKFLHL